MLFVAKNKKTGLYSVYLKAFLLDNQLWIDSSAHSVNEVIDQIKMCDPWVIQWTDNLQEADIWDQYYIDHLKKYLPDIEFVKVTINVD